MQQSIEFIHSELKDIYPETEIGSIRNLLLSEITGFTRAQLLVNKNTKISDNQAFLLKKYVALLKKQTPIQYVIGQTEFYGIKIKVNNNVLIPRPETEELIEWIQQSFTNSGSYQMLDIGTGSGCIAIALKSIFKKCNITAFDISDEALQTASINAKLNNCAISFHKKDILTLQEFDIQHDVIVSNPPYIPEHEKSEILPNVLNHEPHLALFVPTNDPLLFYKAIATFGLKNLKTGGFLFFEIHKDFGIQIVELLIQMGYSNVILRKDISGNDRMIKAQKTIN
ncbi:MAG: peptide chain release factor N(5)-glutamine methyltransferase [Paludibacter sp.]